MQFALSLKHLSLFASLSLGILGCGKSSTSYDGGSGAPPIGGVPLRIVADQVVSGSIDTNGGTNSHIDPSVLVATGGHLLSGYTWTLTTGASQQTPPGVTLTPLTGVVSGASKSFAVGKYLMYVTVTDDAGQSANGTVTVDLTTTCSSDSSKGNPCTSTALTTQHVQYIPSDYTGTEMNFTISTSGGKPPYVWTKIQGDIPTGMKVDSTRGVLRGTPLQKGTYNFYIVVKDSTGADNTNEIKVGDFSAQFQFVVH